jgi:hypothetical protein
MAHNEVPHLWNKIAYLPLRISNPQTNATVIVQAKPDYSSDPTIHIDLPSEVIEQLGLPFGKTIGKEQDEDKMEPSWPIKSNEVQITCGQYTFKSIARTMRHTAEIRVFPAILELLPPKYDLTKYLPVRPHPKVFMSHSHKDKFFCKSLARTLNESGIEVWIDEAEMKVGQSLIAMIRDALDNVDFVVAIISSASVKSQWVNEELDFAMNKQIKNRKIIILPVVKDECILPGFLEGKYFADFRKPWRRKIASLGLISSILSI